MANIKLKKSVLGLAALACACGESTTTQAPPTKTEVALENRAYIVSRDSEELTVIDLDTFEIVQRVPTGGVENHMAELNADFSKIYVDSSHSDETVVIDARTFAVRDRLLTGKHPSHLTLEPNSGLLAIMLEGEDAVSLLDTDKDEVVKKLEGLNTPHFMRFTRDGRWGYVANANANHLTRVRMDTLEIDGTIQLDGTTAGSTVDAEGGFKDAQIDSTGTLYAAHQASGKVLVYDTLTNTKLSEIGVGKRPWVVFAEHPFAGMGLRHVVPNFGDSTLSVINGLNTKRSVMKTLEGDDQSYGVNYSPLSPSLAFVMNRTRRDVAIVDTEAGDILERLDVGGNTETASTTADGKWIVAAVSGANRVVIIDVRRRAIHKILENVGRYPWSVTIPGGQNYCH